MFAVLNLYIKCIIAIIRKKVCPIESRIWPFSVCAQLHRPPLIVRSPVSALLMKCSQFRKPKVFWHCPGSKCKMADAANIVNLVSDSYDISQICASAVCKNTNICHSKLPKVKLKKITYNSNTQLFLYSLGGGWHPVQKVNSHCLCHSWVSS